MATQRLLEAAAKEPVKAFVYASSSSVYGDTAELPMREPVPLHPVSPYGVSKACRRKTVLPVLREPLRPHHGPAILHGLWPAPTVRTWRFIVYFVTLSTERSFHLFGDGQQTRDFTYVSDAVEATVAAAARGRPGSVYNIGGGSRVSLLEVIEQIEKLTGSKLRLRREPSQKGDMRDTYADTTAAPKRSGLPA